MGNTDMGATRQAHIVENVMPVAKEEMCQTREMPATKRKTVFCKENLDEGMIVKTSDGRYGIVIIEDATDKDCIKLFYDPRMEVNHGVVFNLNNGDCVIPLERFTDDLKYICSEEEALSMGLNATGSLTLWSISDIYKLSNVWHRSTCFASCRHLSIKKDTPGASPMGYCKMKNNDFVGFMEDIHAGVCYCDIDIMSRK